MCTITHASKETDLRIDSNSFKNLYKGTGNDDFGGSLKTNHMPPKRGQPAPQFGGRKKVPEEWADIKNARTNAKYDEIPDPYAAVKQGGEEAKASKKLAQPVGRTQKSHTVVQKKQVVDPFEDDFGSSNKKKSDANKDDFDFDFNAPVTKKNNSSAFDFDDFGNNLPNKLEKPKSSNDWSDGIVFDGSQDTQPKKNDLDDIFGGGMLQPQADAPTNSNNPFEGFSAQPKQENPYVSNDVFANNTNATNADAFASAFTQNNNNWGNGFGNPAPQTQQMFNGGNNNQASFIAPKKQEGFPSAFSGLNPFSEGENNNNSKAAGAPLPPGVNSTDLFS
jgi:hypothetical protein